MHIFGEGSGVTSALEQAAEAQKIKCSHPFLAALGMDGPACSISTDLPFVVRDSGPLQEGPVLGIPTYDLDFDSRKDDYSI